MEPTPTTAAPDAVPTGEGGLGEHRPLLSAFYTPQYGPRAGVTTCSCMPVRDYLGAGFKGGLDGWLDHYERTHVADLLARARETAGAEGAAEALAVVLLEMEATISDGDVAEVSAPVAGEVGRSEAVERRDALYEEPEIWLRAYIQGHDVAHDRHVVDDWYDAGVAETAERIAVAIEVESDRAAVRELADPNAYLRRCTYDRAAAIARAEGATDAGQGGGS